MDKYEIMIDDLLCDFMEFQLDHKEEKIAKLEELLENLVQTN